MTRIRIFWSLLPTSAMYDPSGRKSPVFVTVMSLLMRMSTCVTWTSRLIRVTPGKFLSITNSLRLVNTQAYSLSARSSRAYSASALSPPDGPAPCLAAAGPAPGRPPPASTVSVGTVDGTCQGTRARSPNKAARISP